MSIVLRLRKPDLECLCSKQWKAAPANLSSKENLLQGDRLVGRIKGHTNAPDLAGLFRVEHADI